MPLLMNLVLDGVQNRDRPDASSRRIEEASHITSGPVSSPHSLPYPDIRPCPIGHSRAAPILERLLIVVFLVVAEKTGRQRAQWPNSSS